MKGTQKLLCVMGLCWSLGWLSGGFAAYGDDSAMPAGAFNPPKELDQQAAAKADSIPKDAPPKEMVRPKPNPPAYLKQMPQAALEVRAVIIKCKNKYLLGTLKTHARLVYCINPGILAAYRQAGYPYMDLIEQTNAKRLEVARQIDKKIITQTEGEAELTDFSTHIANEERRRNDNPESVASETSPDN